MRSKVLKIIGWILLILIAVGTVAWFGFLKPKPPPVSPDDRAKITLMPLPAKLTLEKGFLVLDSSLSCVFKGLSTPRLERAVQRFYKKLSNQTGIHFGEGEKKTLVLDCTGSEMKYPVLGDNESYSIRISGREVLVTATTETGILYALETLIQLVKEDDGSWVLPQLSLKDHPRYPWRGLMIDACRHWIPKEVILRNLEGMASAKMNVFHWHLTEQQGFRVESKLYPRLTEMGSNGDFYTQEDIREVVEYAADRGIRVVPEFDVPGHTGSWFIGYPELASGRGPYHLDTGIIGVQPAMDPTREEVYHFLDEFTGEMSELFPDPYLHIGGDEVVPTQWEMNPDIQAFMKEHGLEDFHALQAYFNARLQKIVAGHGKIMMGWDEILHPGLPREGIVVQTWRDHASFWESARLGYQGVLSAGYYLDHKQPASYHYNVDPTIIPGAVEIEIDSSNWRSWDCKLKVGEMSMDGSLFLFGKGDELRGIMDFIGKSAGFSKAGLEENHLDFQLETDFGEIKFETELEGDSIFGSAKLAVFNLQLKGWRTGGTDMEGGAPLPEFKKIEPLTPEQESRLLGGEACMWSEIVDAMTIESRIWPRAAAVGEKLWSPKILTDNVPDMYRRLMVMDTRLENLGMYHRSNAFLLTATMVDEPYLEPLRTLVSVLQEDKMFNRLVIYKPAFYLTSPLNRVVDAALPESLVAYRFGKVVDAWLESGNEADWDLILGSLEIWASNHHKLAPAIEGNPRLKEVETQSINLSRLATLGLDALTDPGSLKGHKAEIDSLFTSAGEAHGGTILALVEPVKKLVDSAAKN